jgi:hypothetical protein
MCVCVCVCVCVYIYIHIHIHIQTQADIRALERCELLELTFDNAWPLIKEIPALWTKLEEISKQRSGKVLVHKSERGRPGGEKAVQL